MCPGYRITPIFEYYLEGRDTNEAKWLGGNVKKPEFPTNDVLSSVTGRDSPETNDKVYPWNIFISFLT